MFGNNPSPGDPAPLKFDNGHASGHHLEGSYGAALTQKVHLPEGGSFHIDTPVSPTGEVGESTFNFQGYKKP